MLTGVLPLVPSISYNYTLKIQSDLNMKIYTLLHGLYPRSENLITATRALDRKRIGKQDFEEIVISDRKQLADLVSRLRIDFPNDGMFKHQDLFRPLIKNSSHQVLTRFFNTNTFYRQPLGDSRITFNRNDFEDFFLCSKKSLSYSATLPSPLTFARLSNGRSLKSLQNLLVQAVKQLDKKGFKMFVFHEPYLTCSLKNSRSPESLKTMLDYLKLNFDLLRMATNSRLALITYFGNAAKVLKKIAQLSVDIIGFDCYETYLEDLKNVDFKDKGVFLGVIDAGNSLIEEQTEIIAFVKKFVRKFKPKEIFLGNNYSLEFVPQKIANKKLTVLAKVAKKLQKIYE